jgi:hypothetical protein
MLPAKILLTEVISSLRNVIGPAVKDSHAKSQAYMAAVILEFVSRQLEDQGDLESVEQMALTELFDDLSRIQDLAEIVERDGPDLRSRLCHTIEALYGARGQIAPQAFEKANRRIRLALRQLLDAELRIANGRKD